MKIGEVMQLPCGVPLHEVDILLAYCVHKDRVFIYSHPEYTVRPAQLRQFKQAVRRRQRGEPIAYITGHKEFFGLDFIVNRRVLIPRPDTELIVEQTLAYLKQPTWQRPPLVVDIGTGSGNIAVTLAKHFPDAQVMMADISPAALTVAKTNARRHGVKIKTFYGNLLNALPARYRGQIDVLICNAPYLSKTEAHKKTLRHEPNVALTPRTGQATSVIKQLLKQAPEYLAPRAAIFLEIGYRQAKHISAAGRRSFPAGTIHVQQDLGKFDRVVALYNN